MRKSSQVTVLRYLTIPGNIWTQRWTNMFLTEACFNSSPRHVVPESAIDLRWIYKNKPRLSNFLFWSSTKEIYRYRYYLETDIYAAAVYCILKDFWLYFKNCLKVKYKYFGFIIKNSYWNVGEKLLQYCYFKSNGKS